MHLSKVSHSDTTIKKRSIPLSLSLAPIRPYPASPKISLKLRFRVRRPLTGESYSARPTSICPLATPKAHDNVINLLAHRGRSRSKR
jgi:hypothetical protein